MDLKKRALAISKEREQIPHAFVYLMSLDDEGLGWVGGSMAEVSRENAARFIVDKSHRLATPEEVETFLSERAEHAKQVRATEAQKLGNVLANRLNVPEEPKYPAPIPVVVVNKQKTKIESNKDATD